MEMRGRNPSPRDGGERFGYVWAVVVVVFFFSPHTYWFLILTFGRGCGALCNRQHQGGVLTGPGEQLDTASDSPLPVP